MAIYPIRTSETLQSQIARLEQKLQELLSETQVMDDEVNAVERDLKALQNMLAEVQ